MREPLRQRILFRRLNLAELPYALQGPLDLVFCRNVMIYFDRTLRQALAQELGRLLAPGGLLITGHAESLSGMSTPFPMLRPSVYRR